MKPVPFNGADTVLGAPSNWDASKHGECQGLPVRINTDGGLCSLSSRWKLDAEEFAKLLDGGYVELTVFGETHLVVSIRIVGKD